MQQNGTQEAACGAGSCHLAVGRDKQGKVLHDWYKRSNIFGPIVACHQLYFKEANGHKAAFRISYWLVIHGPLVLNKVMQAEVAGCEVAFYSIV